MFRRVAAALVLAGVLSGGDPAAVLAQTPSAGGGDVFSTNTDEGGTSGAGDSFDASTGSGDDSGLEGALPGEPAIDRYGRDAECGGTNRTYYDKMYGTAAVVMSPEEMYRLYPQGAIMRCGACPPDKVICWLKLGEGPATASSAPPSAPNGARPADPDAGMRCPGPQATPEAIAAGCRWMGGQDLCANADWYSHPQCVADPGSGAEPWGGAPACTSELKRTGSEALDTMIGMGQQADRMLTAFGQTIAAAAAQVMDPKAFAQKQVANVQALLTMLATDNRSFNETTWKGFLAVLEQAKKDPASAIGSGAAEMIISRGVGAAQGAAVKTVCKVSATVKKGMNRAKELKKITANQPRKPFGAQPACSTVNPSDLQFGCVPRSIAHDMREDTGFGGWTADNFKPSAPDLPLQPEDVSRLLKSLYGERRYGTLSAAENLAQANGDWIPTTIDTLKVKLAAAGDGARALVIAEPQFDATVSHVFNVRYQNGLQAFDAEKVAGGVDYLHGLFDPYEYGPSMKVWYYRTGGPDLLP